MFKFILNSIIVFSTVLLFNACSKSNSNSNSNTNTGNNSSNIVGTWQYKSFGGSVNIPGSPAPLSLNCSNTSGTITFNTDNTVSGASTVSSDCIYQIAGQNIPIPSNSFYVPNNGTKYNVSGSTLQLIGTSNDTINAQIKELTTNKLIFNINRTFSGVGMNIDYTLEK